MVSALGDEHTPTTPVVTQLGSSGPETVLTVCHYVAIMTVIISNYYSFSARLRTPIV